jgi:hypothetical protein
MTSSTQAPASEGRELASALLHAIGDDRLDDAQRRLEELQELNGLPETHPDVLRFRVLIAIQRGQAKDALHYLNGLDAQLCPELRVLCMFFMQDPLWQGLAAELAENSADPEVRQSMALLIQRPAA